jgi:hypothetical protein
MSIAIGLLEHVEAAGGVAEVRGEQLHLSAPEPLPGDLMDALRENKSDVIGVLSTLRMSLSQFEGGDCALEIRVDWFPQGIWFVPTEAEAAYLVSEGESRGRIWTARELADLISTPGLKLEEIRTIQAIKEEFDGHLSGVRKAESQNAS